MKILLAVDGSDCSKAAAASVAARPWPPGSELRIVSSVEPAYIPTTDTWVLPENYYAELDKIARDQAHDAIKSSLELFKSGVDPNLKVISEVLDGPARDVILDEAEKWGADLIVLGSHGYRGLKKFILGSVSHAVATHAHCSVEVIRQK
ncbi:MAG: universal stress protein [Acidobacteria bacterium]|nr:universal stress protein [Acidobacteriota bacterium]MBK8315864.1 universal stress protein [Acidobacteriota bacterium]